MAVQSPFDVLLDFRSCMNVKTLPVSKPYGSEVFWERFHCRQRPPTHQAHSSPSWGFSKDGNKSPGSETHHLEPKILIGNYLGQLETAAPKQEISEADDDLVHETPPHSSQENEKLPPKCPRTRRREDTVLRKHLCRTRQCILAVKQGHGYFHLLQKEEQEAQDEQRRERQRKEELRRTEPRPPSVSSDSDGDGDTERWPDIAAVSSSKWKRNRKIRAARPFTPIHRSVTSAQPHLLPRECVFRQLCCVNWLLEVLTLERLGRFGPVTFCWDAKDPGRSRTTIKTLNKEKAIEAKWEQFIGPAKTQHLTARPLRLSSEQHLTWKSSGLSVLSSLVTVSSVGGMSSLPLAPDHTCDDPEAIAETLSLWEFDFDPPPLEYLQKLLDEAKQSVVKPSCASDKDLTCAPDSQVSVKVHPENKQNTPDEKMESQRVKSSSPVKQSPGTSQLVLEKEAMLDEIKASFEGKAEELTLNLSDALDRRAKKRWEYGLKRYQSLCNIPSRGRIPSSVTSLTSSASVPRVQDSRSTNTLEDPYSTQWLSALLSSLAPIKHSDSRITCLLEKLSRFTESHTLRVHPHVFLRVLNSLQPWELCSPDLCVAIEIVRENVVKMPKEEYDSWLHNRINQSQTIKSV